MRFANIEYLPIYLGLIVLVATLAWFTRKKQKNYFNAYRVSLSNFPYLPVLMLTVLSLSLLSLSLLRPQGNAQTREINQTGRDVAVIMDISYSMLAEDVRPSRLELAKRKVSSLLKAGKGDRFAFITFSGVAFAEVPLTIDYSSIKAALRNLNPRETPLAGTNFVSAAEVALSILDNDPSRQKAVVFITDGEDFTGNMDSVIESLKENNISVYGIGIGTTGGGKIILDGQYAVDDRGNTIETKLEEAFIVALTEVTGGSYTRATSNNRDVQTIYKEIEKKVSSYKLEETSLQIWTEYFQFPLLLAAICILIKQAITFRHGLSI